MQFGFGAGILTATRNDIAGGTPIRFGVLQDIQVGFDGEMKSLYGQGQVALDVRRGKMKIDGKAKFAQISGLIMANMFFGTTASAGSTKQAYNEEGAASNGATAVTSAASAAASTTLTFSAVPAGVVIGMPVSDTTAAAAIPAGTTVTAKTGTTVTLSQAIVAPGVGSGDAIVFSGIYTVTNSATFAGDLGVAYANTGNALVYTSGVPTVGEYSEVNGVYAFNAADDGVEMLFNYLYITSSLGYTINYGNPLMGNTPKFQANLNQQLDGNQIMLILYSCVAGKLSLPTKLDDYIIQEFDFMAMQNAAGNTFQLSTSQ